MPYRLVCAWFGWPYAVTSRKSFCGTHVSFSPFSLIRPRVLRFSGSIHYLWTLSIGPNILKISKREQMVGNFPVKNSSISWTIQPKIAEIWGNSKGTVRLIPGRKISNILVHQQGNPLFRKLGKKAVPFYVWKTKMQLIHCILNNPMFCAQVQSCGWIPPVQRVHRFMNYKPDWLCMTWDPTSGL